MTLRPPLTLATPRNIETGWDVLGHEVAQQKAHTLATLATQVEQALARLRAFDAGAPKTGSEPQRSALVNEAADRVWALMIQRELCGLRHWDAAVKEYGIPREVLNRVGQVTR
jgi:acyl transferase domain-containing protein